MLNRVNTYLKRIPLWQSLTGLQSAILSRGLCAFGIEGGEANLIYTPHATGKIDLSIFKKLVIGNNLDFVNELSLLVERYNLTHTECIWTLDPSHYQLLLLEDLPVEPAEFQSAIRWKIKGILSYPVEDAVIDSFPIPMQKTFRPQKMIMLVVARASYLQPIIDQIQLSGLKIKSITVPELALRNISVLFETHEMSSALIYLQKKHVDLIVTHQKNLYLTRRIDFDTGTMTMESHMQIEKLALEIQRSFDYFQSQWRLASPAHILFSSTRMDVGDMAETLSSYLATSVKTLDLSSLIGNSAGLSVEQQNKLLFMIGSLLNEEINEDATAD